MTVWNEQTDEGGRRGSVQKLEASATGTAASGLQEVVPVKAYGGVDV
jgi:hypothetical protein